jgi:hypothetical protein
MPDFLVEWSIDLEADSAEDAARQAWALMRGEDSTANSFRVYDEDGNPVTVDLQELDEIAATAAAEQQGAR